jgi:methionyl aminopeptidase
MGSQRVTKMRDGWTLKTHDGSLVAQYEHTIVITDGKPILVTAV